MKCFPVWDEYKKVEKFFRIQEDIYHNATGLVPTSIFRVKYTYVKCNLISLNDHSTEILTEDIYLLNTDSSSVIAMPLKPRMRYGLCTYAASAYKYNCPLLISKTWWRLFSIPDSLKRVTSCRRPSIGLKNSISTHLEALLLGTCGSFYFCVRWMLLAACDL